ncbi:MAG TPA: kinase/pyrophosphorylase, partial [Burkholderiales bacterium]|nr:kinase/pyrophosphorylase [Burkholderiales bacterium]
MSDRRRTVFFVSDGTGITVEMLGHSLLTQFDGVESTHETIPFIDSVAKAEACVTRINAAPRPAGFRPVVFTTLVNSDIRDTVHKAD